MRIRTLSGLVLVLASALAAWAEEEASSSALLDAAARGDRARVSVLLTAGADPDARDAQGRPAILLAATSGREDAVRALLRGGAAAGGATRSGWTALHEAAAIGTLDVACTILDAAAAPDPRDRMRGTPLDVAERTGHDEVAALLRKRGARGSGKSLGDTVCVRRWTGDGYCGVVVDRDATRHRIRVSEVVGCESACDADASCSGGRLVGPGGLTSGDRVWVPTSCLTHTGLR